MSLVCQYVIFIGGILAGVGIVLLSSLLKKTDPELESRLGQSFLWRLCGIAVACGITGSGLVFLAVGWVRLLG